MTAEADARSVLSGTESLCSIFNDVSAVFARNVYNIVNPGDASTQVRWNNCQRLVVTRGIERNQVEFKTVWC